MHTIAFDPLLMRVTCSCGDWTRQDGPIDGRTCQHLNTIAVAFMQTLNAAADAGSKYACYKIEGIPAYV